MQLARSGTAASAHVRVGTRGQAVAVVAVRSCTALQGPVSKQQLQMNTGLAQTFSRYVCHFMERCNPPSRCIGTCACLM
jgi:hypothetical protein